MTMASLSQSVSQYVSNVLEKLITKNPDEKEFHQAATEILESLQLVFERYPEVYGGESS